MKVRLITLVFVVLALLALSGLCSGQNAPINPEFASALQFANNEGKLLIVEFYGTACGWCKKMNETLADSSVKALLDKSYYFCKVDVGRFDQHTSALRQYRVNGIPHIIIFNRSGAVKAICGYKDVASFKVFLERNAGGDLASIAPDLKDALQAANQAGKLLLVDFYGSQGTSRGKLDETLSDSSVKQMLDKSFYYYKLEVGQLNRHTDCLKKYYVRGLPYIIVFNPDGSPKATSYGYKDADKFKVFLLDAKRKGYTALPPDLAQSDPVSAGIQKAADMGLRPMVYFYDPADKNSLAMDKALREANKAGVAESFALLRIQQPLHKDLAAKYDCQQAPFLIFFKKDGRVNTFFAEPVTSQMIEKAMSDLLVAE
jgi:thioredoxin-related protein